MKKILLILLLPFFFLCAQSAPSDSTKHIKLYQWSQGANPGATGLNNNWKKIDTAVSRGVWYPEWNGAVGDGVTDDATAFGKAIDSARGKTLILTKPVYKIGSKIEKDLADSSLTIVSYSNSIVYLTNTTSVSTYTTREGNVRLYNGGNVTITGIKFQGIRRISGTFIEPILAVGDGGSSLSNLLIQDCKKITLDKMTSIESVYASVFIEDCERAFVTDCIIDSNSYGGIEIIRTGQVYVTGNEFSYNGTSTGTYGYGISCSHRYGEAIDNEGIYVAGNKAWYNQRKCIDIHGGIGAKIINNDIKGFTISGIGAVNEAGSDPSDPETIDPLWAKRVMDIWIVGNRIEQDEVWYDSVNTANSCDAIQAGSFATTALGGGSVYIHDNLLIDCNVDFQRAPIFLFINIGGSRLEAVSIKDNIILNVNLGSTYQSDGVIYLVNGTVIPRFIDIAGNKIRVKDDSTIVNGIKVNCENSGGSQDIMVDIHDNKFYGAFTNPIYANRDLQQRMYNNTVDDNTLPDMIDPFSGSLNTILRSSASSPLTKDLLSINANGFEDGLVVYSVKIIAAGSSPKFQSVYLLSAYAKNDATVVAFGSGFLEEDWILGTQNDSYRPSLSWVGSGDTRTLRLSCPTTYTNYNVSCEFSSNTLQLFRTQ